MSEVSGWSVSGPEVLQNLSSAGCQNVAFNFFMGLILVRDPNARGHSDGGFASFVLLIYGEIEFQIELFRHIPTYPRGAFNVCPDYYCEHQE